ncbi:MAG: bifunctional metallophosphatase/5'-nucleotidase, partial [Eubacteriales bacterium]
MKRILTIIMVFSMLCVTSITVSAVASDEVIILHTNDTHCDIENGFGFAGVSAYKSEMIALYGDNVTLVDAGDAVQGGAVGKLTEGEAIIQLMNEVGYDIMTP